MLLIMDIRKIIQANLRRILKERNMSQRDLAQALGKTDQQVSSWFADLEDEKKSRGVGAKVRKEICEAIHIKEWEFFVFEGEKSHSPKYKKALDDVLLILESDDQVTRRAMLANIEAFKQAVSREEDNKGLKREVGELKKRVKHLEETNRAEGSTGAPKEEVGTGTKKKAI